jgi:hypothetical protein
MNFNLKPVLPFPPPLQGSILFLALFPTLKRGASKRCAYGAIEIRDGLIRPWIHAVARLA